MPGKRGLGSAPFRFPLSWDRPLADRWPLLEIFRIAIAAFTPCYYSDNERARVRVTAPIRPDSILESRLLSHV